MQYATAITAIACKQRHKSGISLVHLPGNGVAQLLSSIHLHVLGQSFESGALRLGS